MHLNYDPNLALISLFTLKAYKDSHLAAYQIFQAQLDVFALHPHTAHYK